MSAPECIKTSAKQLEFLTKLVEEAEQCADPERMTLLYGMAKDETDNLSKSLRQYLSRKLPSHKIGQKSAA
ncbi:MAG: hypothetical protein HON14_02745 [Rhodospirillaceae bacterium]|jgi:hypothetical protein|nr:hypothetical protein [Rhodospirillaceae bacterium]MBT4589156.1 hypothetical protein [Rhodospirillaceae bacterium]MBT4938023.1 hypothetical protein [Rhodospirillaceae bacterium]MBT5940475.1 hypothetical protein [Rhodospirillaceae bacterium]MBT7268505.1 hypothetical protein [Rhodospirillaceae bacterium]